jgi:glycosyltransferase involved in cell wall biosynthesis
LSLSKLTSDDAAILRPQKSRVVPNGIPDPIPKDDQPLLIARHQRQLQLREALQRNGGEAVTISVLFLALCTRDKGVIDALQSIIRANTLLQLRGCPARFRLTVAGEFVDPEDRQEFDRINSEHAVATVHGFLDRDRKNAKFQASDLFLFPTYYANEGQPLNLVEAMAWGLPIVTTRWRAIPEILPVDYPGIVDPHDVEALATRMLTLFDQDLAPKLRNRYLEQFTVKRHLDVLAEALRTSFD